MKIIQSRRDFIKAGALTGSILMLPAGFGRLSGTNKYAKGGLCFAILSDLHYEIDEINHFSLDNLRKYAEIINSLNPDFVVLNGDNINDDGNILVNGVRDYERFGKAYEHFFNLFLSLLNKNIRVYPVMGNHDPCFPGPRNMNIMHELMQDEKFLHHHRELIKKCTKGKFEKEFYSWDMENWHFLTIPCGGTKYLEALDVFNWLDQDLRQNQKKPVIVFMHVPPLGIGMSDSYFIDAEQKGRFMDLFSRYGNVKYVFAGHIHNSTKVSVRSARNYKGTNYVVCPTHVWYQRPFGKNQKYPEEFTQQNHGFIIGYLKGNKAELYSILPNYQRIAFPKKFEKFTYASNPVNFYPLQSLPANVKTENLFGAWKQVDLDFSKLVPAGIDFDSLLVAFTLSNDGLKGHEMSVFFDDIILQI